MYEKLNGKCRRWRESSSLLAHCGTVREYNNKILHILHWNDISRLSYLTKMLDPIIIQSALHCIRILAPLFLKESPSPGYFLNLKYRELSKSYMQNGIQANENIVECGSGQTFGERDMSPVQNRLKIISFKSHQNRRVPPNIKFFNTIFNFLLAFEIIMLRFQIIQIVIFLLNTIRGCSMLIQICTMRIQYTPRALVTS